MNRQSVAKTHKPKNSTLLPATDILQHQAINRTDYSASAVDTRSPAEQQIDKPGLPGAGSQFIHDFTKIPVKINSPYPIQAKLKIGQPNDKYEQEADRVAEQVMRMPELRLSSSVGDSSLANITNPSSGSIQRACASCSAEYKTAEDEYRSVQPANLCPKCRTQEGLIQTKQITPLIQRQEELAEEEDEELVQAKTTGGVTPEVTPAISSGIQSLQGGGRPLSGSERSFFEPRFGADFSKVRVHNDARAANAARSVNARAFTLGHNVVFGAGEYSSDSLAGRKLLAHELTHVVQQRESVQRQTEPGRVRLIDNGAAVATQPLVLSLVSPRAQRQLIEGEEPLDCKNDPIDKIDEMFRRFVTLAPLFGFDEAAEMLAHYLNKKRTERTLPHTFVLQDPDALSKRKDLMLGVLDIAFAAAKQNQAAGKNCAKKIEETKQLSKPVSTNKTKAVWYAMGRFNIELTSVVILWKACHEDGNCKSFTVVAEDSFEINDKYDWHPGLKVNIPRIGEVDDECAERLRRAGRAEEFWMRVRWSEQQAFVLECTPDEITFKSDQHPTAFPLPPVPSKTKEEPAETPIPENKGS